MKHFFTLNPYGGGLLGGVDEVPQLNQTIIKYAENASQSGGGIDNTDDQDQSQDQTQDQDKNQTDDKKEETDATSTDKSSSNHTILIIILVLIIILIIIIIAYIVYSLKGKLYMKGTGYDMKDRFKHL